MNKTLEKMADDLFASVQLWLGKRITPLEQRLAVVEARQPEKGERGEKGDPGASVKGDAGERGPQGEKGEKGDTGERGADGVRGEKGDAGDAGPQGEKGLQGDKGEPGIAGERGIDGEHGARGEAGMKGDPGERGEPGEKGLPGDRGEKGDTGLPGDRGEAGPQGLKGDPGDRGEIGERGIQGERGLPGERGEPGIQGIKGDPGENGKSIDLADVEQMVARLLPALVEKAVQIAAEAMKLQIRETMLTARRELDDRLEGAIKAIPPGPAGKDADPEAMLRMVKEAAALVPKARDGRDAPTLDEIMARLQPMLEGEVAKAAKEIPPGRDGRDAEPGPRGEPGKDGIDLESLGLDSVDGGRILRLTATHGDRTVVREARTAIMIHRGVWKVGAYQQGDAVTFGGSVWLATRDTDARPKSEGDTSWRLAVKAGQDRVSEEPAT